MNPALPQPASLDEMTLPSSRTVPMADPGVMMRLYELYKKGSLGMLACTVGHRSRLYRRLWSLLGKPRLLASFRQSSWLFLQRGVPNARTCYAWEGTQSAQITTVRTRFKSLE
jgi:hypothetical protein